MIHVCLSLYDKTGRYSKFTGTTICSIFENTTSDVTVHILHDNTLTDDNRDKFIYLAGRYGQAVKFYNVKKLCAERLAEFIEFFPAVKYSHVSVGTMYRFLLPEIIAPEIKKLIYLDSDIIVNMDIKELWQIELDDKILAAVPEILSFKTIENMEKNFPLCKQGFIRCEDYFNSGVILINLDLLRKAKETIIDGLKFFEENPQPVGYPGQDIWNYCFSARSLKLPIKFNQFTYYARRDEESLAKKIYHYAGGSFGLGLGLDISDSFNRLWMNYFVKTPWFDADSIGRLYEGFLKVRGELEKSALKLSATVSGKTRAFVVAENKLNVLVENFSVRNDEEVFAIESTLPMQKLIDVMNASRGKKIFFILLPGFKFDKLTEAGFVRGEDFLDGYDFLTKDNELKKEAYSLVSKM
ncbi:MAG: glycosyltransferase family 8 protein [Selenomonadaceae bacterium]|nr:glycosyltransferase family 8 protein [Selenomonadaceae bacterium]